MANQKLSTQKDELGVRWLIDPNDPGYVVVEAAKALHLRNYGAPSEVLCGFPPEQPNWNGLDELLSHGIDVEEARSYYTANLIRQYLRTEWKKVD